MTTKQIINWIRGKLAYAPDHAWKNMMNAAIDRLQALEDELAGERYRHDRYVDYTLGLEDKLEQLKAQHRWIPVTERLPDLELGTWDDEDDSTGSYEVSEWVLGIDIEGLQHGVRYERGPVFQGWYDEPGTVFEISHWMPLPEPPKEVE